MNTLAARLLHARTLKTWLQKDLAVASGVSMGMIGMLEKGKRGADGKTPGSLAPLAKALGVNYEWLAHGNGPMTGLADTVGALSKVALAPVDTATVATDLIANLRSSLRNVADREIVGAMLSALAKDPDNERVAQALQVMLEAFTQAVKKQA